MNILGIGPILAVAGAAGALMVYILQAVLGVDVSLPSPALEIARPLGAVLAAVGLYFWFSSAKRVERAFKSHRLETSGVFHSTRNPLYAAFIVFIVPGIALVTGNLMILLVSLAMFIAFKARIGKEEDFLQKEFGPEFQKYALEVPQLLPFVRGRREKTNTSRGM